MKIIILRTILFLFLLLFGFKENFSIENKNTVINNSIKIALKDYDGKKYISENSGRTWIEKSRDNSLSVTLKSGNKNYLSNDRGKTWIQIVNPNNKIVNLLDRGRKYRSADMGKSWIEIIDENNYLVDKIQIYPNPAKVKATVIFKDKVSDYFSIQLFDTYGRNILTAFQIEDENSLSIDVSSLISGNYVLKFHNSSNDFATTIVVVR